MAAELEEELQAQLAEQQEALEGVRQLAAADPSSTETAELLAELEAGIAETESALLGLKRQRLLAELDALQGSSAGEQQQQQQQAHQAEVDGGGAGAACGGLQPGTLHIFRFTDGRHYFGWVLGVAGDGMAVQLQFAHPTKSFQLEPVELPAARCLPAPSSSLHPAAAALHPGARVVVQVPGQRLWEAAEVAEVDAPGQRVAAVTLADRQRRVLPMSAVLLSAYAPDPLASDGSGSEGEQQPLSGAGNGWAEREDGAEDEDEGSGSDYSQGEEGDEEEEDAEEEDVDGVAGYGSAAFGRVSLALAEAAGLLQQQAAAGPQNSTNLFFGSEAHSRGIGSKLLAKMGFKGAGHGLGRNQQGLQQALTAAPMKRGAGLGVSSGGTKEGSKKRRRSGKQRRRDKAAKAGLDDREAKRQAQREIEHKTGSVGLFAVLNSIVGDASQAQAVRDANLGVGRTGSGVGSSTRQGHLFGVGGGGGGSSSAARPVPKEEDRRALAKRADDLVQLRQKVQRLSEMAGRNAKDKVMLPQIKRALAEAQGALAAAEQAHAASHKAIHDREKLKKMAKF